MSLLKRITDKEIFGTNGFTQTKTPRKSVRIVLLDDNNLAAVLHLGKYNFYMLPGGGIDGNETPEQALHREALEETGYACEITRNLGFIEENSLKYDYSALSYCYLAKITGEKGTPSLTQEESDEETQVQWRSLREVLRLIETQDISRLKSIRSEQSVAVMKIIRQRDIAILNEAITLLGGEKNASD